MDPAHRLLVAIDVDGTLVNTEIADTLAAAEIAALEAVRARGHVVALCTGRNRPSLVSLLERSGWFPPDLPLVMLNGTVVEAGIPRVELARGELDGARITALLRLFRAHGAVPMIYGADEEGGMLHHEARPVNDVLGRYLEMRRFHVGSIEAVPDLQERTWTRALEVGTIDECARVEALTAAIRAELGDRVRVINTLSLLGHGAYAWAEVFDTRSGKDFGLRTLSEHYGIPMARTVAIGDNFNDIDMFEVAGVSVAMGNSPDEVKAQVDHLAGSVADGGAAQVLQAIAAGDFPDATGRTGTER